MSEPIRALPGYELKPTLEHREGKVFLTHRWMDSSPLLPGKWGGPREGHEHEPIPIKHEDAEAIRSFSEKLAPALDIVTSDIRHYDLVPGLTRERLDQINHRTLQVAQAVLALAANNYPGPLTTKLISRLEPMITGDLAGGMDLYENVLLLGPSVLLGYEGGPGYGRWPVTPPVDVVVLHELTHFYDFMRANAEGPIDVERVKRFYKKEGLPLPDPLVDPTIVSSRLPKGLAEVMQSVAHVEDYIPFDPLDSPLERGWVVTPRRGWAHLFDPDPSRNPYHRFAYIREEIAELPTVLTEYAVYVPEALHALSRATGADWVGAVNEYWKYPMVHKPHEDKEKLFLNYLSLGRR